MSPRVKPSDHPGSARGRQKADTNVGRPLRQGETFLPHERDESPGTPTPDGQRKEVQRETGADGLRHRTAQAEKDVRRGLRDTDLHGAPSNVPGPGPAPEDSPGAEVVSGDAIGKSPKRTRTHEREGGSKP